jgi:hypothetical protein
MNQAMSVLVSANENDWITNPSTIVHVTNVLGNIELDPASSLVANKIVGAERIYTIEDNSLTMEWISSNIYINPPFGKIGTKSQAGIFAEYAIDQYRKGNFKEGIILIHTRVGYKWFNHLLDRLVSATLKERIRFINPQTMQIGPQAKTAQTLFYLGADSSKFTEEFKDKAYILYPTKEL